MAHIVSDRACETTTTTGTGAVTLAGAVSGYESFSAAGLATGDTCFYCIEGVDSNGVPTGEWEVGLGTYNSTGPTLTRTTILQSSASDAAVTLSAGTKRVYITTPGALSGWGEISPAQLTANTNDWAPTGLAKANIIRLSTDASRNLTGLTGGVHNRTAYLHNVGSFDLVLIDESASSTAANRFALTGDFTLSADMIAALQYDGTTARWRLLNPVAATLTSLTEDTAPDRDADFLASWDASASSLKKVLYKTLRNIILGAGSATAGSWPVIGSGTLLTTAEEGALEHDADALYFTTDAGNRGVVPVEHIIRCDSARTLASQTAAQAIFNSPTNGRLTLETGCYLIEGLIHIDTLSATTGNAQFGLLGAGSATLAAQLFHIVGVDGAAATAATQTGSTTVAGNTSPASAVTGGTAAAMTMNILGTFEVSAAGTIQPSVALVTAAAGVVRIGSYLRIRRIGSQSLVSVGQWD